MSKRLLAGSKKHWPKPLRRLVSRALRRRSIYKTPAQLRRMVAPGRATAQALEAMLAAVQPGITPLELDRVATETILAAGGKPNFALEPGYRHTICANVNEVVVHGIPTERPLAPG